MTSRNLIAIGAGALALGLVVAPLAMAAPPTPQAAEARRTGPPPSNPHDVFRPIVKTPRAFAAECDCPMMKRDVAMRDMCMHMGAPAAPPKA